MGEGGIDLIVMGIMKQFRCRSAMGVVLLVAAIVILVDKISAPLIFATGWVL